MRLVIALIVGVITGFAVSYGAPALDWGFAVNAATRTQPAQWVDRSGKGDRLDRPVAREIPTTRIGKQPAVLGKEPPPVKLLVGCEPVSSPLTGGAQATIPGRCVG